MGLSNERSAPIHSHTGSLSRGVSMPRIDQHALHLGSGIISPRRVQSLQPLASSQHHLPSTGLNRNIASAQAQPDSNQKQLFPTWPQVPVREHSSWPALPLPSFYHHPIDGSRRLGRLARQIIRILLPSSQSRPPLHPRRRYSAAPLKLLDQDQNAHSLIRFSVSGPILSCLATSAHPGTQPLTLA